MSCSPEVKSHVSGNVTVSATSATWANRNLPGSLSGSPGIDAGGLPSGAGFRWVEPEHTPVMGGREDEVAKEGQAPTAPGLPVPGEGHPPVGRAGRAPQLPPETSLAGVVLTAGCGPRPEERPRSVALDLQDADVLADEPDRPERPRSPSLAG